MNKNYFFSCVALLIGGCNYSAPNLADQATSGNTAIEKFHSIVNPVFELILSIISHFNADSIVILKKVDYFYS